MRDDWRHRGWVAAGIVALALVGTAVAVTLAVPIADWVAALRDFVVRIGPIGYVLFILVYVAATATVAPGAPFSLLAGLIFGAAGFFVAIAAATAGASLAFLAARYFARSLVARLLARWRLFEALDRAIDAEGWRIVGLTRMSPLIPFNVQSYLFGATRIGFRPYALATAIGIIPNTAFCVYLGSIGRTSISGGGATRWVLSAVGLAATFIAVFLVTRAAKRRMLAIVAE
jgi:uncharacterized membrane protein YdjX (TVP38/TMEM64 family)